MSISNLIKKLPATIDKRRFWRYINPKLKGSINYNHVFSVIVILFDEMVKDLKEGKKIRITNFGTIYLQQNNPRKYFNVTTQRVMQAEGNKILKFAITPRIVQKIRSLLDMDKIPEGKSNGQKSI